MSFAIHTSAQGSDPWHAARRGLATASTLAPAIDPETGHLRRVVTRQWQLEFADGLVTGATKADLRAAIEARLGGRPKGITAMLDMAQCVETPGDYAPPVYTLADRLWQERYTDWQDKEPWETAEMLAGHAAEDRARREAAAIASDYTRAEVHAAGLCLHGDGHLAASPDALVYLPGLAPDLSGPPASYVHQTIKPIGGIECKFHRPSVFVALLRSGETWGDPAHRVQVHACMAVTGARWWDYIQVSSRFHPSLDSDDVEPIAPIYHREHRSQFTENLLSAAAELDAIVRRIHAQQLARSEAWCLAAITDKPAKPAF